jgi:TadE-like protein
MLRSLFHKLRRFTRRQDGSVTVEFAIVFPVFITIFLSVFEGGLLMSKLVMLDRGLDITVRAIRLAPGDTDVTADAIKTMVCENSLILQDCEDVIQIEMVVISADTWTMPDESADCIDRTSEVEPVVSFSNGDENDIMFIRACVVVDPMFPTSGLGLALTKDDSGGVRILASSAFAIEPR